MFNILISPQDWTDPNKWVVYSHSTFNQDRGWVLQWIGCCRVHELLIAPDAWNVPAWRDTVQTAPQLSIQVQSLHDDEIEAMRAQLALVKTHKPPINAIPGVQGQGRGGRQVLCLETGVVYRTARECAAAHGLFESQLSAYLARRNPGKLRGYTFRRV